MQKDPYIVLGLSKGASREEIDRQYNLLKDKYSSERFESGETGMEAARKLSELEQAYKDCIEDLSSIECGGNVYTSVENAIKNKNYDDAQRQLDDIDIRDAEWHYYQSMVYFKKGWYNDSKTQIEISIALDPYNSRYTEVRDKMTDYVNKQSNNASQQTQQQQSNQYNQQQQRAGYSDRQTNAENNANACCDSCCTLMCCDSCCECMGGDLIPCC